LAEERRHLKEEEERSIEGGYGGGAEALLPLPGEVAGAPDHPVRHLTTRSAATSIRNLSGKRLCSPLVARFVGQ